MEYEADICFFFVYGKNLSIKCRVFERKHGKSLENQRKSPGKVANLPHLCYNEK